MVIKKENKLFILELLQRRLNENKIDIVGLGWDYFALQANICNWQTSNCVGSPEEQKEWHTHHVNKCLKNVLEALDFLERWEKLVAEEGKKLNQEKKKAIERIKSKDTTKSFFSYTKHEKPILDCTNSNQLAEKEKQITQEIEQFSSQAQADETQRKKQERENKRLRKEEEEKQQKSQKNFEEEEGKIKEKLREENQSSNTPPKNNESSEKLNNLKNRFYELYQKDKKYKLIELMKLLHILDEIGKQVILDKIFLDAKTELQIIRDKIVPYQSQLILINSRPEETIKEKLERLEKHELENCKEALEEMEKIIHLNEQEKNLLEKINDKLKTFDLEEELRQLKNNKTENPQQQAENQKKVEEKEKELEQIKKQYEGEENKQFQISPEILSEFSSLSDNFNTKEKIESLINPVKDNPEFLLEIKTKYQVEGLETLLTTKSSEEVITIIKRFEYDNLSPNDKEIKTKKIKAYYQQLNELAKDGKLTEEQINQYLYKRTIGEIDENGIITNLGKQKITSDAKSVEIFGLIVFVAIFFLGLAVLLKRLKKRNLRVRKNWNSYLTRNSDFVNKNIRANENIRETLKWKDIFDDFNWGIRLLLIKFKSKWNTAKHE